MSPFSPPTTGYDDDENTSLAVAQPVVEQAEQAIASGQFEWARTLIDEALTAGDDSLSPARLFELLGQAQVGLQNDVEAAQAFQHAYDAATEPHDTSRLFHFACQAYQQARNFPAIVQLADRQLEQVTTARERAKCLLVAGEASIRLRRYRDARERYLLPAANIDEADPATRIYIWNYMGFCAFAEHRFAAATEAFQKANAFGSALQYERRAAAASPLRAELHHLRNTAHFYTGVMRLIEGRPQAAVQALQAVQPPLPAERQLYTALFLALAHLRTHRPEAAEQALQPLARATVLPESARAPYTMVRALIANGKQRLDVVGTHLEAAIDTQLQPHSSWEPSWHALMLEALGMALLRAGYRDAVIACYEESLKIIVDRIHPWGDAQQRAWLRGPSLLSTLENVPVETWSPVVQSEMLSALQTLAWLYQSRGDAPLADAAYHLALRTAITADQRAAVWLQRGWLMAMRPPTQATSDASWPQGFGEDVLLGVQAARSMEVNPVLRDALRGMEALLSGDKAKGGACFDALMACPEMPRVQTICLAGWLWSHARQGRLAQALAETPLSGVPVWHHEITRLETLERLFMWTLQEGDAAPEMVEAWLSPLCVEQGPTLVATLRLLSQPDYLPEDRRAVLMAGLSHVTAENRQDAWSDPIVELMGYDALVRRLEPLLATCNQPVDAQTPATQTRKRRPRRRAALQTELQSHRARLLYLVERLSALSQHQEQDPLPDTIMAWLLRYPHLSQNASEVVGALLGLLREHPGAATQRQVILDRVDLSKRQRQLLQEAQREADSAPATSTPDWEPLRYATLDRLLASLRDGRPHRVTSASMAAINDYTLAVTLSRVGLVNRATDVLQACLRQAPGQPLAHFMLGQILRLQHRYTTAWDHTMQAWELIQSQASPPTLLHLQVVNQILALLGNRQQREPFLAWIERFQRLAAELQTTSLSPEQEGRLHREEGECALSHALYLRTVSPAHQSAEARVEQQLELLAEAIAKGTSLIRHDALHGRADLLSRWQRQEEAAWTYTQILEQWPNDRRARLRLVLLTAFRLAASPGGEGVEPALAEALALAFAAAPQRDRPSPLTLHTTLTWLRHASARDVRYSDVADVMTAYGRIALQCEELDMAIEILEALYEILGEPRQAYDLAKSYQARSQQAVSKSAAWHDCKRAMALAQQALESELHRAHATVLLEQLEADQARLAAAQRPEIPERNPQPDHPDNATERQVMPVSAFPPEVRVSQDRFSFLLGFWWRLKRGWLRKSK